MTIETIYKAVNGIKFYEKEGCERYEANLTKEYQTVKEKTCFYDKDFKVLPFPTIEEFYNIGEWVMRTLGCYPKRKLVILFILIRRQEKYH